MSLVSATDYSFAIDGYNASNNTVSASAALPRITECTPPAEMAGAFKTTAYGDTIDNEAPTGQSTITEPELKGFVDVDNSGNPVATSAFAIIGRPSRRPDYPGRTLKVTHKTGLTADIEVFVKQNQLVPPPSGGGGLMFHAKFGIAAKTHGAGGWDPSY